MNDGLAGYLKKSEAPERIVAAVRGLASGIEIHAILAFAKTQ
jgi:DNA-binding NarL/FixJ family response regulator